MTTDRTLAQISRKPL